jgi:hypothetical protein
VAWDHREVLELAGVRRAEFVAEVRDRARRLAAALKFGNRVALGVQETP